MYRTVHLSNNESGNELMQKVADAYADDAMLPNSVLEFGKTVTTERFWKTFAAPETSRPARDPRNLKMDDQELLLTGLASGLDLPMAAAMSADDGDDDSDDDDRGRR